MTAMLMIGGDVKTIREAKEAIVEILKVAGTEGASVAAMNTLAVLAKSPDHTTVSQCTFTSNPPKKGRKSR